MRESMADLRNGLQFQLSLLRLATGCEKGESENAETVAQSQILEGLVETVPAPVARPPR